MWERRGAGAAAMVSALLAALAVAAATDIDGWDAGLQGADWRQRQHRELGAASAAFAAQSQGAAAGAGELLPCPKPPPTPSLPAELPPEIEELVTNVKAGLDQMFARSNATAGSAALVYGDRVLVSHGWGSTTKTGGKAVDGDTVFGIGSISKVFTDLLLLRATDDGAVSPSTPITDLVRSCVLPLLPPSSRSPPGARAGAGVPAQMAVGGPRDPQGRHAT